MKKVKAFTLIELTIGMAVVAVLIVLGIVGIGIVQKNARDTERNTSIAEISTLINDFRKVKISVPEKSKVVFNNEQVSIANFRNYALKGFLAPGTSSDTSHTRYYYNTSSSSEYVLCVLLESGAIKSAGTTSCPPITSWL